MAAIDQVIYVGAQQGSGISPKAIDQVIYVGAQVNEVVSALKL